MKRVIICLFLFLLLSAASALASETEEWLTLTVDTQEEADALYEQYAQTFDNGSAHIIIRGDSNIFMPFLQRFQFSSLALDTLSIYGGGLYVTDLANLTELCCNAASAISSTDTLKALTLRFYLTDHNVCISEIGDTAPNLEKLTLVFTSRHGYNISFYNACVWPESLSEVIITMDGDVVLPQTAAIGSVIAALQAICPDAIVNGSAVAALDAAAGLTPEEVIRVRQVDASAKMTYYLRQLEAGTFELQPGDPVMKDKLVILVYSKGTLYELSIESALTGDDFFGLPNQYLAKTMDEALTAVIIYSDYSRAGTYSGGSGAYGCTTMTAVIDLETGIRYEPYEVAYDAPAAQITGYQSGSGSIEPEAALADLLERIMQ